MARRQADALIQINETEGRENIFDFSDYLLESQFSIFTSTAKLGISGLSSLRGMRVGVESGKGEQIMLESRILAVADVVEAMASHRPYRAALGIDSALEEIERGRGKVYDAAVVDACIRLFAEQRFVFSS